MQGILYEEHSAWLFLLVTLVLGGAAAWATGRAIALTWRPFWQLFPALAVLGLAVRFIHFSYFGGTLLTWHFYLVDTAIVMVIGLLGWRYTRTGQMITQYSWLYERTGPLTWRARASA